MEKMCNIYRVFGLIVVVVLISMPSAEAEKHEESRMLKPFKHLGILGILPLLYSQIAIFLILKIKAALLVAIVVLVIKFFGVKFANLWRNEGDGVFFKEPWHGSHIHASLPEYLDYNPHGHHGHHDHHSKHPHHDQTSFASEDRVSGRDVLLREALKR